MLSTFFPFSNRHSWFASLIFDLTATRHSVADVLDLRLLVISNHVD